MTPELQATSRLRRYLLANVAGIVVSVVVLALFGVALLRSAHLWVVLVILVVAALVQVGGVQMLRSGRSDMAAASLVVSSWLAALGATYVSPFIVPVSILIVIIPVVIVFDFLRGLALRVSLVGTVLLAGVVAYLGQYRHGMADALEPDPPAAGALAVTFTIVVAVILTLGLGQQVSRLRGQARELADSRRRLAAASDEARRAIERDLHDGAQQRIVATGMRLRLLQERLPADQAAEVDAAVAELQATVDELRRIAQGVRPILLDDGLAAALAAVKASSPIPFVLTVGDLPLVSDTRAFTAYLVVAEAVANVLKHARASRISVTVAARQDWLAVEVVDDGVGGVAANAPLTALRDRIVSVGGTLGISGTPGGGTTIQALI